ncbi:hypothetical protein ACUXLG_005701 [Ralstonia sp. 121560039-2]|jgi:hypothetical protein
MGSSKLPDTGPAHDTPLWALANGLVDFHAISTKPSPAECESSETRSASRASRQYIPPCRTGGWRLAPLGALTQLLHRWCAPISYCETLTRTSFLAEMCARGLWGALGISLRVRMPNPRSKREACRTNPAAVAAGGHRGFGSSRFEMPLAGVAASAPIWRAARILWGFPSYLLPGPSSSDSGRSGLRSHFPEFRTRCAS